MDELEINGKTYPIKFNHRFYDRVVEDFAKKHKDSNVDGFNNLINGLIMEDPDAVVRAYRFACQTKSLPSANDVANALDEQGIFDSDDIFNDVYKEIKSSGFLALKIRHLLTSLKQIWKESEVALQVVKENTTKGHQKEIQQATTEVAINEQAYELAKKQLAELGK
ncbi:hypothetical protein FD27_GL001074 [Limosilactobacillus frumenti DSM 13145]|uniref:Phage protein n=1 Tax=Limosilactobacillus frumenti DSM 13145 TaxID=1423746 RepID=A0A0R1PFS4_9LACO|nr:tail assembly chaperone [Limosilactobacillus frumenti]KRL27320.1 hypothetical protein FD27_GL001074 [Limosilactobacillus frumenti DSM 13145]QFG72766.1 hypothetical protein LF145_05195 [Limosilactobacillus frumenti]